MRWLGALLLGISLWLGAASSAHAVTPAPWAEGGRSNPQDLKVMLITFGPGSDLPSWFGHTAIAVEDTRLNRRRLYNYGMFRFDATMVPKYIMGRLEFWVGVTPYKQTLRAYARQDRDVRVLELNLPPKNRAEVAAFLEENIQPDNREYLYHHYYDNCATRIRDILDEATDGQFKEHASVPARMSLRDHTRRHAIISLLDYGMMYAMSSVIDAEIAAWDEMFLPVELENQVKSFTYVTEDGERIPLAGEETVIAEAQRRAPTPEEPRMLWPWMLFWGLLAGGSGLLLMWWYLRKESRLRRVLVGLHSAFLGAAFGGAGTLLAAMWIATDHTVTYHNENLFFTNPITLLVFPVGVMFAFGSTRAQRWLPRLWIGLAALGAMGLLVKVLPWFDQQNWLTIALCAPLLAGMAVASRMLLTMREAEAGVEELPDVPDASS